MPRKQGTPANVARAKREPETSEVQLPQAAVAAMQADNQVIEAAKVALSKTVATILTMAVPEGWLATNVNLDTGVVSLTRGPALAEVTQEE